MAEEQYESEILGQGVERNQRRIGLPFMCGNKKECKLRDIK
jgi:hypothetical protein